MWLSRVYSQFFLGLSPGGIWAPKSLVVDDVSPFHRDELLVGPRHYNKRRLMHIIHPPHHLELDGRIFSCSRFQHRKLEGLGAIIVKSVFFLLMAVVPKNIFKIPASVDLPSHSWVFTALLPLHPMVLGNGVFAKTTTATVRRRKWLQNGCRRCKNDERHWDIFRWKNDKSCNLWKS